MESSSDFDYYLACGTREPVSIDCQPGILLCGGAQGNRSAEHEANQWFLARAKGGKYLVLRVGGIGSQADWICRYYRDWVHSAAELSIHSREAANNSEVIEYIRKADILFIPGADQIANQEYFEGTQTQEALNYLINDKKIPVAGTGGGMAMLVDYYYAPDVQGILSSEILNNPFHGYTQTIHRSDSLQFPYLQRVIIDAHLDRISPRNPEQRYGRLLGLLARVVYENNNRLDYYAIGLEQGAFVAIDEEGIAKVFGNGTKSGQNAYFLQTNGALPEQISPGWPLIWNNSGKAVKVYRISGTREGNGSFDLKNWFTARGGEWEYWYTEGGISGLRKEPIPTL